MITVPEATKKIIQRSRYLSEAISKGLINYSALARYIKPELEQILMKNVTHASIIMALNRLETEFKSSHRQISIFKNQPEILVRSGLNLIAIPISKATGLSFLINRDTNSRSYFLKNQGSNEVTFILSQDLFNEYKATIESKQPILVIEGVCSITINLPEEALMTPGTYYFFLKSLAWEHVNILEIVSTPSELTFIVEEKDVQRAFAVIKSLFSTI